VSTLQDRTDAYNRLADETIARYGWMIQSVFPVDPGGVGFSYTVGLAGKGLPEFIVFGWDQGLAQSVLNHLALRAIGGEPFAADRELVGVLEGHTLRTYQVGDSSEHLTMSNARYRRGGDPVAALQLVWPDMAGRWPGDPDCNITWQPLLGEWSS
jgi:hypothetical protein